MNKHISIYFFTFSKCWYLHFTMLSITDFGIAAIGWFPIVKFYWYFVKYVGCLVLGEQCNKWSLFKFMEKWQQSPFIILWSKESPSTSISCCCLCLPELRNGRLCQYGSVSCHHSSCLLSGLLSVKSVYYYSFVL